LPSGKTTIAADRLRAIGRSGPQGGVRPGNQTENPTGNRNDRKENPDRDLPVKSEKKIQNKIISRE
jgi:hypothetical protein